MGEASTLRGLAVCVLVHTDDDGSAPLVRGCDNSLHLVAIQFEERDLVDAHGPSYAQYRRNVPMLIPRAPESVGNSAAQTTVSGSSRVGVRATFRNGVCAAGIPRENRNL